MLEFLNIKRNTIDFRVFWTCSLLASAAIFFLMIFQTTGKFLAKQTVVRIADKEIELGSVPFPAVTICPESFVFESILNFENISNGDVR